MRNSEFYDFVSRTVIIAMFSDDELMARLVLKGGNAMNIVYGDAKRASLDVDFSIAEKVGDFGSLGHRVKSALETTFFEHGFQVFDFSLEEVPSPLSDELRNFWGGYDIGFKLIELEKVAKIGDDLEQLRRNARVVSLGEKKTYTIDVSCHEAIEGKVAHELDGLQIYVYSPDMIVAEKLRAICQQMPEYSKIVRRVNRPGSSRGRDFFDIHNLCARSLVDVTGAAFHGTLLRMFDAKKVPIVLIEKIEAYREAHRLDFAKLKDTVQVGVDLRDFDFYFDYVVGLCHPLKVLWIKDPPS